MHSQLKLSELESASLYLLITYRMHANCHLLHTSRQFPSMMFPCYCISKHFYFFISTLCSVKDHWAKWKWKWHCPGNYPLVYIQPRTPELFTFFNLRCRPCVSLQWAAVRRCCHYCRSFHLPFLTAFSCPTELTLLIRKVPLKCQRVSKHSWKCSYMSLHHLMKRRGHIKK